MDKEFFDVESWYQIWGGRWCPLSCSYWGYNYTKTAWVGQITFLDKVAFVFHNKNNACFAPISSINRFSKYLALKVEANNRFANLWAELLKVETDRIRKFISDFRGKEITYEQWQNYVGMQYDYYTYHRFVKYLADSLKPGILETILPVLEDARNYSEPVFTETEEFISELAAIIGKNVDYNPELILRMLRDEFEQWWKTGKLPEKTILENRIEVCVLIADHNREELYIGKEAAEAEELVTGGSEVTTLKGMAAYPGKISGVVRLINNPHNVRVFNDGDILVTTMTRVEFLPLMKKAAAFITDSGGILSHAAIMARELKKPCIIGTQKATKVLKDGDTVEVDANKGIVRKV